jgi:tetratricopeptide (TPR) repeat protein
MHRLPLLMVCSLAAMAQQPPPQDPLDTAIQSVWQARNDGRFEEATAARERARNLLQHAPVDSPRFADRVLQVAQSYSTAGLNAQARTILHDSLARTVPLGDSHPTHIAVLIALGDSWRQDGNLLKAVEYLEEAAAAQASAPAAATAQPAAQSAFFFRRGYSGSGVLLYTRLAELYRQLGRPDAVSAIALKIGKLAGNDETALARFYEQNGQLDEAAATYAKVAEQSPDPQTKINAWQSLANVEARQERYTGAVAAIQQAIAAFPPPDNPGMRAQALYQNQTLAGYLSQAGQIGQADEVYQQLLRQNQDGPQQFQVLGMYAQYLADTKRSAQGESMLQDYLTGNPSLDPQQKAGVLFSLANLARRTGDSHSADAYQRAAQALQPQSSATAGQIRIEEELQEAQTAANEHRLDDADALALHALDIAAAGQAVDARQVQWSVPQIAQTMAANKDPVRAERLFLRVFALAQSWSVDGMQPLIALAQQYPRFLLNQPGRVNAVPAAIEQYRGLLIDANGPDSGTLAEPLQMQIELERSQSQWERAEASARELLELQESLSGNTSDPYFRNLRTAAQVYEGAGDSARALPLLRKAITVADLLPTPDNGWRRADTRMAAALALARQGQFDEAEELGEAAVALQRTPPFEQQLEQIRGMQQAAPNPGARRAAR